VQLDPQLLDAQFNLGVTLVGQGSYDEALQYLKAALRLKPDSPVVRAALTEALTHAPAP
jgi:cytochrome c-type biogenesis protein CcmH/NrfG